MKKNTAIAWSAGIAATFIGLMPQRAIAQMQPTCTFRQDVALSFPSRESVLCFERSHAKLLHERQERNCYRV